MGNARLGWLCLLFLSGGAFPFPVTAANPPADVAQPGDDWKYQDVVNLIRARERAGTPIESPDALLAALPVGMRRHFTFVFDSSNKFQAASPLAPRALVFNRNLVYSFNGAPNQRGYHTVEFLELDEARRKIELREIAFEKKAGRVSVQIGQSTPAKCLECHGANPRPLWAAYHDWPGVYGSNNDDMYGDERANYLKFRESVLKNPASRYAKLIFPDGSEMSPYPTRLGAAHGPTGYELRINLLFTKLLVRFNAVRLAQMVSESPYYERMKWVLPLVTQGVVCSLHDPVRVQLHRRLDEALARMQIALPDEVGLLVKSMALLGLKVERFNMAMGANGYTYPDGTLDQMTIFTSALLDQLRREDDTAKKAISLNSSYHQSRYPAYALYERVDTLAPVAVVTNCDQLRSKAAEAAATPFPAPPSVTAGTTFTQQLQSAESVRANAAIPVSCVFCHTVQRDAPRIPFDDEARLKAELGDDSGRLMTRLVRRSHPSTPSHQLMPPVAATEFSPLSAKEHETFRQYLVNLVGPVNHR